MRIIIVDDHPLVRQGLALVLKMEEDMEVVGECACIDEAVSMIGSKKPDVALIDLKLGRECGLI